MTAGSVEVGGGREREMWARIRGFLSWMPLLEDADSGIASATPTHEASVEGEERNSTALETPWTG